MQFLLFSWPVADLATARNKLLEREEALRREMEAVAAEVRALPPGGPTPEDYEFDHIDANEAPAKVRFSELFRPGTDTPLIYHHICRRRARAASASFADHDLSLSIGALRQPALKGDFFRPFLVCRG